MSESNERHCAGTVQSHGVGIRYVKQMCLETGPEDSHRRCGSDMFRQTVPDTSHICGTTSRSLDVKPFVSDFEATLIDQSVFDGVSNLTVCFYEKRCFWRI